MPDFSHRKTRSIPVVDKKGKHPTFLHKIWKTLPTSPTNGPFVTLMAKKTRHISEKKTTLPHSRNKCERA